MSTSTRTVAINVRGKYTAWEIPPRCRKPRDVDHDAETTVHVPVVTAAEAPVVIRSTEVHLDETGNNPEAFGLYRGWNGRLFERQRSKYSGAPDVSLRVGGEGRAAFSTEIDTRSSWGRGTGRSLAEFEDYYAQSYADTLIIEEPDPVTGEPVLFVWAETSEPRYVIHTLGLGNNHSVTDLSSYSYDNPNIAASHFHRADDFAGAKAHAIEVALDRGDTKSVPRIEAMKPLFEVIDPAYVTLVVPKPESRQVRDLRYALSSAAREYRDALNGTADIEADAWGTLVAARTALAAVTDDITGTEAEKRPYEAR